MPFSRTTLPVLTLLLSCVAASAQRSAPAAEPLPTAEAIMARVAANQDHAEAERGRYVYTQHAHVVSRKDKTVMCEETTDERITPSANGSEEQLLLLDGRVLVEKQYVHYTTLSAKHLAEQEKKEDSSISISTEDSDQGDRNLVEGMRSNLIHDSSARSKDGIAAGLFPLTSKTQERYHYHLAGREHLNGREVFHIDFRPKDKDDYGWKGDAYIDTTAYQPVVVRTTMARKLPFYVRTLLGTSLPGLGFTVVYAPLPDGLWFPISFGTEFKIHLFFFYSREILIDAQNRSFEKTHVNSKILPVGDPVLP